MDVRRDAVMAKDVNKDLIKGHDIFTPIAATDLGFDPGGPVVEAGPILFRIPVMEAQCLIILKQPSKSMA